MSAIRNLEKPPIKEAVIEFQFQPLIDLNKEDLIVLYNHVKDKYNEQKFLEQKQVSFNLDPSALPQIKDEIPAFLLGTVIKDKTRGFVVQFKRERLAISKLKPYTNFEEVEDEALLFFNFIKKHLNDIKISRIGVRYINEINYLKDYHKIFDDNPLTYYNNAINGIQRFYNQSIFDHSKNENTILNLVIDTKMKQVIIDIDSYQLKLNQVNDFDEISEVLKRLRKRKNSIFFQIVSNKLEEVL